MVQVEVVYGSPRGTISLVLALLGLGVLGVGVWTFIEGAEWAAIASGIFGIVLLAGAAFAPGEEKRQACPSCRTGILSSAKVCPQCRLETGWMS